MRPKLIAAFLGLGSVLTAQSTAGRNGRYVATAYSVTGITASGEWTHRHVIAADPDILPIGSRVKVKRAGRYSGEYVVADTGANIQGRKIDIYMPSDAECKRFGMKRVQIRVVSLGDGTRNAVKQADTAVKGDVASDLAKGTVGDAATDVDWKAKGKPAATPPKTNGEATPVKGTASQR
jgi:3D (Asp-Asp-Asp) domain-containing protein